MQTIKIGTRGSKLALAQAKIVEDKIKEIAPDIETELVIIKTQGDKILDKPLSEIGDKGLFVCEFEEALLKKEIDIAVHSAKDLPTKIKEGLEIISTPKRADANDVLITRKNESLTKTPIIGTSSPRRELYIKKHYPNAHIKMIRGNVDTRLKKLTNKEYDAIILAKAGIDRLNIIETKKDNFEFIIFEEKDFIPAACQGIIAIEARTDYESKSILQKINDEKTFFQYTVERKILELLQIDCSEPSAAFSQIINNEKIDLTIMYGGKEINTQIEKSKIFETLPTLIKELKQS